jgi:hypothetical protein
LNFILSLIAVVFFICAGVPLALLFTMLDWIGYRDDRVMWRIRIGGEKSGYATRLFEFLNESRIGAFYRRFRRCRCCKKKYQQQFVTVRPDDEVKNSPLC